ncbi:MAG TPA: IS1595 family transposase [Stellaceae bacterium]|nr:IS1595 family transposase [Stellaceae bacterium]
MATNQLSNPTFQDADKAREWLEAHLWAQGRTCPFCGTVENSTAITGRAGLYQCNAKDCRKQFTVTVGTLFERSHIALNKWLLAAFLIASSKKGISTHQMHRMIGVSYKSTWFMLHRLREAARDGTLPPALGGQNKVVEADETYIGGKETNKHKAKRQPGRQGGKGKAPVLSLVERGGKVRSRHVGDVSAKTLRDAMVTQIDRASYIMTDEAAAYTKAGEEFAGHGRVNHSAEEYVRAFFWHTNTVEGYFSILKRGVMGTYHHVSEAHLHRYLAEFDFRYNERTALGVSDSERAEKLLAGIVGKRLTYRRTGERAHEQA